MDLAYYGLPRPRAPYLAVGVVCCGFDGAWWWRRLGGVGLVCGGAVAAVWVLSLSVSFPLPFHHSSCVASASVITFLACSSARAAARAASAVGRTQTFTSRGVRGPSLAEYVF